VGDRLPDKEIHHHDIVHFALSEIEREICNGRDDRGMVERLREHLNEIQDKRQNS
jgi:hypothetical protein